MIVICNEKKLIDHISNNMWKRHGIITENFNIFSSNIGKTGNVPEFLFGKF